MQDGRWTVGTDPTEQTTAAAATQQAAAAAVDRFLQVKRRELAAHRAAVEMHAQAAALQERLGHPQRAAQARAHAEHAKELHRLAAEELAEYQARITAARNKAGKRHRQGQQE
jgi:hypothetical protein